ncbi:uncharacterized protein [Physcomitrium patens]|uniref:uncharacterized protein isoform X2 n=1 Tax=Physcomitrium patens TaxID=3218 RepID=UPI000D16C397|nr:uncharacterized protein LOC112293637 isoform X2 [Physcomitrium patens]|eukprot:XP_024399069.1 uncharacterized protein LOC112293637 isoform X2 [Physcomitrella patens]
MGSLMAGWDNNPWNEEKVLTRSRTSLTKEKIEEYWRKRQQAMEEHLREASAQKSPNESGAISGLPKDESFLEKVGHEFLIFGSRSGAMFCRLPGSLTSTFLRL